MNENNLISGLIPLDNINIDAYYEPLIQGISDKNITNIALSGSVGSGKSSIIKSFEKKCLNENKKFNFLNISLADFENSNTELKDSEIEQNLERSILQKIFYTVSDKEIPFSRFKRIKDISEDDIYNYSLELVLWSLMFSILFYNDKLPSYFQTEVLKSSAFFVIFIAVFRFSPVIIKIFNTLSIASLDFLGSKIDFGNEKNASILNKNIDEIIYFFKVTKYNIVVFEDLDRYNNNLTIYKKLREINTIINGSNEIGNKKITFLYAIKDDYFNNENRTKFFDLILPVIPVVDYTNASDKIREKLNIYNATYSEDVKFTDDFIADIGLFLSNMRLISNVFIEFVIYSKIIKLNNIKGINHNIMYQQLFCLLTYKTLYPSDFANLLIKKGILFSVLQQRDHFASVLIQKLNDKIKEIELTIKKINEEPINDIKDIQNMFLGYFISQINSLNNNKIFLNDKWMPIKEIIDDNNFEQIKSIKPHNSTLAFSDIKDTSGKTYDERIQLYKRGKTITLEYNKKIIEELEELKRKAKYFSLDELIIELNKFEDKQILDDDVNNEKLYNSYSDDPLIVNELKDFIQLIISQKYVNVETYELFTSHFYEENLNSSDRHFIINVKNSQNSLYYDYELTNLHEISRRLSPTLFNKESILNFDLFEYIYKNLDNNKEKYDSLIEHIAETKNLKFINYFLEYKKIDEDKLLKDLVIYKNSKINSEIINGKYWLWDSLDNNNFILEKKYEFTKYILKYFNNFKELQYINSLKDFLTNTENEFLFIVKDLEFERITIIIKDMNLIFDNLNKTEEKLDIFKFIYENNLYNLKSKDILLLILSKFNNNTNSIEIFNKAIVSSILNSTSEKLKNYFKENISCLIDIILENSTDENNESIILVANDENINLQDRLIFLGQQNNKLEFIAEINDDLLEKVFELNKVEASWINIFYYMNSNKNVNILISFINKNYENLINNYNDITDGYKNFISDILFNKLLDNEPFKELIKIFNHFDNEEVRGILNHYQSLDKFEFSNEKLEFLINENLIDLSEKNYNYLNNMNSNLHIILIKNFEKDFENNTENDVFIPNIFNIKTLLTLTEILSIKALNSILSNTDINTNNLSNNDQHNLITFVENIITKKIELTKHLFIKIYKALHKNQIKIKFLTSNTNKEIDDETFKELIQELGDEYINLIKKNGKKPRLSNNVYNNLLAIELKKRGFISNSRTYSKNNSELEFFLTKSK